MAATEERPFVEYLPAVLREDEVDGTSFLRRFLAAFEELQAEIQSEVRHVPELFAVTPTPVLSERTSPERRFLELDSAAGLQPGDVLRLRGPRNEFVEVSEIRFRHIRQRLWETAPGIDPRREPELAPRRVSLRRPPRFEHPNRTPVDVVGEAAGPSSRLAVVVDEAAVELTVFDPLALEPGDVLRVGEGARLEYAEVVAAERARLRVLPPLLFAHGIGEPVMRMALAEAATPTWRFPWAERGGSELVVTSLALSGEARLELDTVTGLEPGDVLQISDLDPARIEFIRVAELPERGRLRENVRGIAHGGVILERGLEHDHEPGTGVVVLGDPLGRAALAADAREGAAQITVDRPAALEAAPGDALRVGEAASELVQVLAIDGQRITVAPELSYAHGTAEPVVRIARRGAGKTFISWLASWLGLTLRPDRGERWNRELIRRIGRLWPWRGTRVELETFLESYLEGEVDEEQGVRIFDPANPLQVGLVSRVGDDTVICGGLPHYFVVDIETERRASGLYTLTGLSLLVQAALDALRRDKPAHTYYDLRLNAHTMQIGVDPIDEIGARVGRTTLLWSEPLVIRGEH